MGADPRLSIEGKKGKVGIVLVVLMITVSGLFILGETDGTVTPGQVSSLVSTSRRTHENSTAIPVMAMGATSNTGSDRLSSVIVTVTRRSTTFTISDLSTVGTNMSSSGIAIYRDDGSRDDELDPSDTPLNISSISSSTGSTTWTYTFSISNENVPTSLAGTYQWFVVVRTSASSTSSDAFDIMIPASGITFSDSATMPSSLVRTSVITIYLTTARFHGTSSPIPLGEYGSGVDAVVTQGMNIFSGAAGLESIDSIEVGLSSVSGFDPFTDLRSIDNTSSSGLSLYLDDGSTTPDVWDPDEDTMLVPEDIRIVNGSSSWRVLFDLPDSGTGSFGVPTSSQGSFDLFLVVRSSSSIGHGDRFITTIPAWGVTYSGSDGISRSVLGTGNVSRVVEADTRPPDLSNASLRIYTNPTSGYLYEADTDLSGRDEVFYNSLSGQGLGVEIFVNLAQYIEDFPLRFVGEDAFDKDDENIDPILSDGAEISYTITADIPDNPLTFYLEDRVGHNTSFDVYFTNDNTPPRILNLSLNDASQYIESRTEDRELLFRPSMVTPHSFHISGNAFEGANESGLLRIDYSLEPSLHSSPASDTTPSSFNGTYYIDSVSTDSSSPLYVDIYDKVQNRARLQFNYTMISSRPEIRMVQPSSSGINVSGVYRVTAQVRSEPSILSMEFGVDGESQLRRMTYGGFIGDWETYYIDWDTVDQVEGEHVLRVKATDMTGGVSYNNSIRVNVNNYPLWGFFQSPLYGSSLKGVQDVYIRTSSYLKRARLYVGTTLVDTFTGYPRGGRIHLLIDTTQFEDGSYQLKAELEGFGGRSADLFLSVKFDNTDPVIERIWVDYPGVQKALKPGDTFRLKARMYDNTSGMTETYVVANSIGGSTREELFDNGMMDDGSKDDNLFSTAEITANGTWAYHTIRFVAEDAAGNRVERKMLVAIDDKDPLVERLWIDYPGGQQGASTGDRVQIKAQLSDSTVPIYITLVLDNSGSMFSTNSISHLQRAAKSFINQTRSIDYVAIYRFYWTLEKPFPGGPPGWDKRLLNFTRMDDDGKALALSLIDNIDDENDIPSKNANRTGTPIWDTIGNATRYTIDNAKSTPIVVAFTDGADNYISEFPYPTFEEGSQYYCPWHDWGVERYVDYHWGKYPDALNGTGYYWVKNRIDENRKGLLNAPIPVYTIGLGLEHHDPPNVPARSNAPYNYEKDNTSAYWFGESGTPEYNLWRIAATSAGGQYFFAPSATYLESVYRKISESIYATGNPARIRQATALLPLDLTLDVDLYNDGLHGDGKSGDNIWSSAPYEVSDLPTETRAVILDIWDWANNTNSWSVDLVIDNAVPDVESVTVIYPDGRSSVGDGERFHIEINVTDRGSGIRRISGNGEELGYFPPILFNNTGKGNDRNASDTIYTSDDIIAQTGDLPSVHRSVMLSVTDLAGNLVRAKVNVLLVNDRAAPVVSMIEPSDQGFLGGTDPISCMVTDDGDVKSVIFEIRDLNGTLVRTGFIEKEIGDVYTSHVDVRMIPEGTYTLEIIAEDSAGRMGSSGLLDIGIDNTIPLFSLLSPRNGSAVGGLVTFLYTFKDRFADHVGFSVDDGPFLDASTGLDTTIFSEGYHRVSVRGFDGRGASQGVVLDLYFDNSVPDVQISLPSDGVMLNGSAKVLARVMDGGGIDYVEARIYEWGNRTTLTPPDTNESPVVSLRMDGPMLPVVTAGFFEADLQTWGLPDGRYVLDVTAVDRSGTEGHSLRYMPVDNNAPTLRVLYPVNGGAVTGTFIPDVQVEDPFLSRAYLQFMGSEYPFEDELDMNGVPDGKYLMRFVAIDTSLRTTAVTLTVYVDKTPPGVELLSPGDGYSAHETLTVLARIDEASGIRYAFLNMDGDDVAMGEPIGDGGLYSFELDLGPFDRSAHIIKVKVENTAGLISVSESRTIYKDYLDTDGDGVIDPYDDDPLDPLISGDVDNDGFGSFYDDDDDGDGILDEYEPQYESLTISGESKGIPFRMDPTEWSDVDEDGIGDNSDPDADGDSIINELDAFPYDPLEWSDMDHDGIGDNSDPDRDGDGVMNGEDDLPDDPNEWKDTDGDGIGNNKDDDDDNDGLIDSRDDFPTNKYRKYRYLPLGTYTFLVFLAVGAIFSALVFRERISDGLERSWKEGRLKRARNLFSEALGERELRWDENERGAPARKFKKKHPKRGKR